MNTLNGCDLTPFEMTPTDAPVLIPFGFDYDCSIGFVKNGETVWSNAGAPVRLSTLIAETATAADLAGFAADLAVKLLSRRALADLAAGGAD